MSEKVHTKSITLKEIGERLKIIRTIRGVSQNKLARDTGVGRLIIVGAEKGERDLRSSAVVAICEYLKCDANWLLGVTPRSYIYNGIHHSFDDEPIEIDIPADKYIPLGEDE